MPRFLLIIPALIIVLQFQAFAQDDQSIPEAGLQEASLGDSMRAWAAWCVVHAGDYENPDDYWHAFMTDPAVAENYKRTLQSQKEHLLNQMEAVKRHTKDARKNIDEAIDSAQKKLDSESESIGNEIMQGLKSLYEKQN